MSVFLESVGVVTVLTVVVFLLIGIAYSIKEWILDLKYAYRIKHRFNKPPTAACYCKDCVRHDNESKECHKFDGWRTADDWFCWDAYPCKKEETK